MAELSTYTPTELGHRSSAGLEVALIWMKEGGEDKAVVSDTQQCANVEIPRERYLALAAYYSPFAARDFSTVEESRLAA